VAAVRLPKGAGIFVTIVVIYAVALAVLIWWRGVGAWWPW
jgi:hypothetical protein